ncbi:MAG: HDIG domain-containing protein, partial [Gemmatimonadetes bacterium]|nr:HDIG domain-containing protein [Gemmatimonadota bacterium]
MIHHGLRVVLILGVALLTTVLFPPESRVSVQAYPVGTVVDEQVVAQIPFEVPLGADAIAEAEAEARASTPPTFDRRDSAVDSMGARLDRFFGRLDEAAQQPDAEAQIGRVLSTVSQPTEAQRRALLDDDVRGVLRRAADDAVRRLLDMGVADNRDLDEAATGRLVVRPEGGGSDAERTVSRDAVLSGTEFYTRAEDLLPSGTSPDIAEILRLALINHMEYSLVLNRTETANDRAQSIGAVRTTGRDVLPGEAIVRANERITPESARTIEAYEDALREQGLLEEEAGVGWAAYFGAGLLNLALLMVFGLLVYFFRRELYTNLRWIVLLTMLVAVYIGVAGLLTHNGWRVELLPIAFVALAASVLWDGRMALVLVLTLAALTSIQSGVASEYVLLTVLIGGSAAALSVRAVRRRAQTWIFIAIISLAYAIVLLGHALLVARPFTDVATSLGFFALNAIFSSILAMGFLPVFEWFAGVTTDQTLLEWADPNRSLLKRLSMEAPGTYAHTINVANLAESAASAIGANGLLCRVGLYYHDVGKMLKPHYFVENQPDGRNPHDRLKPETSAQIVKEHVVAGHKMAVEANVPEVVTDFIVEHHGTQRIGFFYEKALEEYGEENVDAADFTYPGPRPRSRETAIAMLADSVESATRALQDPTPERIRGLVDSIVESKIAHHQLDDAPLTLQELSRIKEQFAKVLSGVYH